MVICYKQTLLLKMGRCSAPFCNNSSEKGYILKVFPRNIEQRNQWVKNMNVKNWTPTNNTRLCEVHFPKDMWEKRADGKSKLKPNAVPIIFGHWITEKTISKKTEELPMEFSIENEGSMTVIQNEQDKLPSTSFIQNEVQPSSVLAIRNELPSTSSVQETQIATHQIKFNQHHDIKKVNIIEF
ncbi:PREDICTED: THAP domain-containing protein 5-like [Cyphomyrmex costatus]|uniref:THAP domain-containing protein 5-like n=1 Tax=Cyphomyrmex costatus TaxID=456900 RepID=UPI00085239D1|nr:PREDICTED: THAP domain-containing protein 5-like [Cyphomyrmex costatus]